MLQLLAACSFDARHDMTLRSPGFPSIDLTCRTECSVAQFITQGQRGGCTALKKDESMHIIGRSSSSCDVNCSDMRLHLDCHEIDER